MLRSMTGFGRSVREDSEWVQIWEIRSVNGRFLDLKWRLPANVRGLESRFERVVRQYASRGRVEIGLDLSRAEGVSRVALNTAEADAMLDALGNLAMSRGDEFIPDYNMLLSFPSLWTTNGNDDDEELEARLIDGLKAALEDWNDARSAEGRALARDLNARILRMEEWVGHITERAPEIKNERFETVRGRLAQMLAGYAADGTAEPDETRFLQEMVIMADRLDVSEELTRLGAHLDRLRELLNNGDDAGRRLDFTLQECFREINTCGNKVQDSLLSRIVVDFKNELEKCREQVQNLE